MPSAASGNGAALRIVVLRALKLGDFLTGVPAYRALRAAFPGAHIVLAAPPALAPLVSLTGGALDELIPAEPLGALPPAARRADLGVNLHGRGPQSHAVLLTAEVRRLIAFRHPAVPASAGGPAFVENEHEVARWCRLLHESGIPADPGDLDLEVPPVPVPAALRGATIVHPGASSEARRWPVERWIAVARAEAALGRRVIVTGGADEVERARAVAAGAGIAPAQVYAGRTSVGELAALVAAAGRVICGDTGIAHLASAYRRPSVVLFGPVSPAMWGPPSRAYHRVLWSGGTGDPHADRVDPGLLAITVERVLDALESLPA